MSSVVSVVRPGLALKLSSPPSIVSSRISVPATSITMLATFRARIARTPFGESVKISAMTLPWNSSVSVPACPSTMSLPSPGFQMNRSSPSPPNSTSLPPRELIVSLPGPPRMIWAPIPPVIVSLPSPPEMVVVSVSVKAPLISSISTVSSPPPASTAIVVKRLRRKLPTGAAP